MKKIMFTGGGTVGHVTLNLLLIPKFIEGWMGSPLYWGQKRNRIPRDQEVWLRRAISIRLQRGNCAAISLSKI